MKKLLLKLASATFLLASATSYAQLSSPFQTCPSIVAIARPGTNAYNNDPVNIYNVNPTTGTATIIPGGPIKNPSNTALNMDVNAAGLNGIDRYLYVMGITQQDAPFYRVGSNYSIAQVGTISAPAATLPQIGIVNAAAGEFDGSGNYYFTAIKGTITLSSNPTFIPQAFYLGKITGAASLPYGSGNIANTYTAMDFSGANCGEFFGSLTGAVSQSTAQNTGLRDLLFNPRDGRLYTYVSFEYPTGSNIFKGQLLSINPVNGVVTCYPSSTLSFLTASNEVAGTAINASGDILILLTGGSVYKTVSSGPNVFTGAITLAGQSGITGGLRGDLAACVTSSVVPVSFVSAEATESNCSLNVRWTVGQEQNVNRYEVESAERSGSFISLTQTASLNSSNGRTYAASIPVTAKTMSLRIKQIGNDGSVTYSDVFRVNTSCNKTQSITVFNNASITDNLQIRWNNNANNTNYSVKIYNSYGALVTNKTMYVSGSALENINVSALAAGAYMIVAESGAGDKLSARFVKQ